jgi:hypothetical protein
MSRRVQARDSSGRSLARGLQGSQEMLRLARLVLLPCLTVACAFGLDEVRHDTTPLPGHRCASRSSASAAGIEVFFGADLPPRAFERIAFLEVRSGRAQDNAELLDELRRSAAACGADAIVAVDKEFAVREVTYLFVDDEDVEEEHVLTGVAIAFEEAPEDAPIHGWDP